MKRSAKRQGSRSALLQIAAYLREGEPQLIFWLLLSSLAQGLAPLVNVIVPAYILDDLIAHASWQRLLSDIALLALGNLFFALFKARSRRQLEPRMYRAQRYLREQISAHFSALPLPLAESSSALDLLEQAKYSLYEVANLEELLPQIGRSLVTLGSVAAILLIQRPWLLWMILILNLLILPCLQKLKQLDEDSARRSVPEDRRFHFFVQLAVDYRYSKDLKIFGGAELILSHAQKNMDQILKINHSYFTKNGFWNGLIAMIGEALNALIFLLPSWQLLAGTIRVGSFSLLCQAAREMSRSLRELLVSAQHLWTMNYLCSRYIELMKLPCESADEPLSAPSAQGSPAVQACCQRLARGEAEWQFEHVSFRYPNAAEPILHDFNLQLPAGRRIALAGRRIALVGRNGAGKSTLVKLMLRFYEPEAGEIRLNGVPIRDIPLRLLRRYLAPTFQDFALLPFRLNENLAATDEAQITVEQQALSEQSLQQFSLQAWVRSLPEQTRSFLSTHLSENGVLPSGGQGQKLALARSLVHNGGCLIMDEPTAALDPRSEEEIFAKMLDISEGQSALFISHRLSSTRHAHLIVVLDQGRAAEIGSHAELMQQNGLYAALYRSQAGLYGLSSQAAPKLN